MGQPFCTRGDQGAVLHRDDTVVPAYCGINWVDPAAGAITRRNRATSAAIFRGKNVESNAHSIHGTRARQCIRLSQATNSSSDAPIRRGRRSSTERALVGSNV